MRATSGKCDGSPKANPVARVAHREGIVNGPAYILLPLLHALGCPGGLAASRLRIVCKVDAIHEERRMKRIRKFLAAGVLVGGAALAGTAQASDAVLGAVVGGGAGALIGQSLGGRDGAIIGGAIGAAAGASAAGSHRHYGGGYYAAPAPVYHVPPPVYHVPRPVYHAPPVVYRPAPVYHVAPPVVYRPAPVIVEYGGGRGHWKRGHGGRGHWKHGHRHRH